jgi:hypothetical protein
MSRDGSATFSDLIGKRQNQQPIDLSNGMTGVKVFGTAPGGKIESRVRGELEKLLPGQPGGIDA